MRFWSFVKYMAMSMFPTVTVNKLPDVVLQQPAGKQGSVKIRSTQATPAGAAALGAVQSGLAALKPPAPSAPTRLETQGAANLAALGTQREADYAVARQALQDSLHGATPDIAAGQVATSDLSAYRNPFLDRVLGVLQRQTDTAKAGARARAAAAGAFGGSRLDETLQGLDETLLRQQGQAAFDAEDKAQAAFASDRDAALKAALANQQAAAGDLDRRAAAVGDATALADKAAASARAEASAQLDGGLAQRNRTDSAAGDSFQAALDRLDAQRQAVQAMPDAEAATDTTLPLPRGATPADVQAIVQALLRGETAQPTAGKRRA